MSKKIFDSGWKNERGMALVTAMLLLVVLTVIGVAAMSTSNLEIMISGAAKNKQAAFYAAEAGLEHGKKIIENTLKDSTDAEAGWTKILSGKADHSFNSSGATGTDYASAAVLFNKKPLNDEFTYTVTIWNNKDTGDATTDTDGRLFVRSDAESSKNGSRAAILLQYAPGDGGVTSSLVNSEDQKGQSHGGADKASVSEDVAAANSNNLTARAPITAN